MKAFPHKVYLETTDPAVQNPVIHAGMDLRDYFASQAMQGLIQVVKGCELGRDGSSIMPDSIRLSNVAYGIADAMMKAREK
jgi:hypothetical protein